MFKETIIISETRDSQVFYPEGENSYVMDQQFTMNYEDVAICWLEHPVLRYLPEFWPVMLTVGLRDILAKGSNIPLSSSINDSVIVICTDCELPLLFIHLITRALREPKALQKVTFSSTMTSGKRLRTGSLLPPVGEICQKAYI